MTSVEGGEREPDGHGIGSNIALVIQLLLLVFATTFIGMVFVFVDAAPILFALPALALAAGINRFV